MKLSELKKEYASYEQKYGLPSFSSLVAFFDVENLDYEGDTFLRAVRKNVMEKVIEYLRLVEMLLNPINAPPLFGQFIKKMSAEDRRVIQKLYEDFTHLELAALELEISYAESDEAAFIKKIYETWKDSAENLVAAIQLMRRNFDEIPGIREKSYYG